MGGGIIEELGRHTHPKNTHTVPKKMRLKITKVVKIILLRSWKTVIFIPIFTNYIFYHVDFA